MLEMAGRWGVVATASAVFFSFPQAPPTKGDLRSLLAQYRSADPDAAVQDLSRWETREVDSAFARYRPGPDPWDEAGLALLFTEAALLRGDLGPRRVGPVGKEGEPYSARAKAAGSLLDGLAHRFLDQEGPIRDFVLEWYALFSMNVPIRPATVGLLSGNARGLLLLARADEGITSAESVGGPVDGSLLGGAVVVSTSSGRYDSRQGHFTEPRLRKALELSPELVEARVRLGRQLSLFDRYDEADRELTRARQDSLSSGAGRRTSAPYLASLFLGEMDEFRGDVSKAVAEYGDALQSYPPGQAAAVGLARVLIRQKRSTDGWSVLRAAISQSGAPDPWYFYRQDFVSGEWDQVERLKALRASVRGEVLPSVPSAFGTRRPSTQKSAPNVAQAQSASSTAGSLVFRAGTSAVQIDAFVTENGRAVDGLTARDFVVRDNGAEQGIAEAYRIDRLSVAFLIDTSASMRALGVWPLAVDIASTFAAVLEPEDRAAVALFAGQTLVTHPLASSVSVRDGFSVSQSVRPEDVGADSTSLYDAVFGAASLVVGEPRPVIVLISDMGDNTSWLFDSIPTESRRSDFYRKSLIDTLRGERVLVDVIYAPRPKGSHDFAMGRIDPAFLSSRTGGKARSIAGADWQRYAEERLSSLRSGYLLRYEPKPCTPGRHKVSVQLRNHSARVEANGDYDCGPASTRQ